jgi:hypothetical protein
MNIKKIFLNRYNQLFNKEQIYEMYNIYLENLQKTPFKKIWIDPLEIAILDKNKDFTSYYNWKLYFNDPYLKEYNNKKIKLALDIKQNGTYWPFAGWYINNGKIQIKEGQHRFMSILLANHYNKWNLNRKFLCVIVKDKDVFEKDISGIQLTKLDKPITMKIPYTKDMNFFKRKLPSFYNKFYKNKNLKKGINKIKITTKWGSMRSTQIWTIFLRDLFYKYKEEYNEIIKPSPIINNQKKWNNFIKKIKGDINE